tara:strand:+ start:3188 stop:3529 length:342 start_codon:yes stop_codon:yes gene_type:complete
MKKLLLASLFTIFFSTSLFAEYTLEKRELECWDMKSFVQEVLKPLQLQPIKESIIETYDSGKKKKTIDILVSTDNKMNIIATVIVEVSYRLNLTKASTDRIDKKVCILARWTN